MVAIQQKYEGIMVRLTQSPITTGTVLLPSKTVPAA